MVSCARPQTFSAASVAAFLAAAHHSMWFGALSFETRCSSSLQYLRAQEAKVESGLALNYQTNVTPPADAEKRTESNWNVMERISGEVFERPLRRKQLPAYGFPQLQKVLEREVLRSDVDLVFFDITCLTKIHTLALATSLASSPRRLKWILAYTFPENYTNFEDSADQGPGWKDIIIAPLGATALLFNESGGRGILLPGHEGDRLVVALAEIEPAGGLIVMADTEGRPDLRLVSERRNQKAIRHLIKMRGSGWVKQVIRVGDLRGMRDSVQREIVRAKHKKAPVILFPYGPKPLIFLAAYELARAYPEASWFVYPIPSRYDSDYTEGAQSTVWFMPSESDQGG